MCIYLGWGYFLGLSSSVLSIFRYPRFSHRPLQIICLGQFPYHFRQNREGLDILNSHIPDHYPRQYQFLISYPRQYSSKRSFSDSSFHWFSSLSGFSSHCSHVSIFLLALWNSCSLLVPVLWSGPLDSWLPLFICSYELCY